MFVYFNVADIYNKIATNGSATVRETLGHGEKVIGASRLYQKNILLIDIRTRTNVYCNSSYESNAAVATCRCCLSRVYTKCLCAKHITSLSGYKSMSELETASQSSASISSHRIINY